MHPFSDHPRQSLVEAALAANKLAMSPFAFQAVRLLWKKGVLDAIDRAAFSEGVTVEELARQTGLSRYALTVLLEAGLAENVVRETRDRYRLTKVGYMIAHDPITHINIDFTHDVCYQAMFHLEEAIDEGSPAGLKVFGSWPTIYRALMGLPEQARKSWFAFDHYYSDSAFEEALAVVFSGNHRPRRLLDIGGNTGKWSMLCARRDKDVRMTIVDLPKQLEVASANIAEAGLADRIGVSAADMLDAATSLPAGHDAAWMSQFLCCFSEDQIVDILKRTRDALPENGVIFIMDTFWDQQAADVGAYCLIMTSLYFTCLANGNSRMYDVKTMLRLIDAAGLAVAEEHHILGLSHTLLMCKRKTET